MDEGVLLGDISAAYLVLRQVSKRRRSRRSIWVKEYFKTHNFHVLKDLEGNTNTLFQNFTSMSKANLYNLLEMIKPKIENCDSSFREAVTI